MKQVADGTREQAGAAGWRRGLGFAAVALLASGIVARADQAGPGARAVRLSYVQGQVQISQSGQEITGQAAANMPLFEGYQVTTGQDGQAEIQFEDGSVARIAPDSGLTLTVLRGHGADGQAEIVLNGGLGYFELQGGDQAGRMDVRFGDADVSAGGFTVMRINMDTQPGALAVFSGNAHVVRGDAMAVDLHGNESLTFNGSNPSQYNLAETVETNSWDQWNSDRDQAMQTEAGTKNKATDSFVNNDNPAWNDLNANGNWYDVPGQGFVWSPYAAVNAGWDPYGCGQWMWTPQFGYTWVSCYNWGFMPYSCGTWNFYNSFGWGWAPGMGGCNPWWGGGGYGGYGGPNIGIAPSGYHPVIRPPQVLHPPRGRFPRPVLVDREPKHGFRGSPLRSTTGPVTIAGHRVEPVRTTPARTGPGRPTSGFVGGGSTGRATTIGGEIHAPAPIVTYHGPQRQGYAPPAAGQGYQQPRGYEPRPGNRAEPRSYSPPVRSYSPPAPRGEPSRGYSGGSYSGGARPSGGGYHGGGNYSGGGAYHGGAAPGGGGYHGGSAPSGGGGGYHGGGAPSGGGGGGGFHGGGGGGGFSGGGGGGGGGGFHGGAAPSGGGGGGGHK